MSLDASAPGPLPRVLRPWRPWLDWFAPDLADAMGQLLQRLHPLFGARHGQRQGGDDYPVGVDDLRVRGPYERLLASEWLMADELPDEFLRRAAAGEHLFLMPRPHAHRVERTVVALFDAGPLQLGAPRLAHLAIWILLARRARERGGELRWGVLQQPGALHEAQTVQQLRALLRAHSFMPAGTAELQAWEEALAQQAPTGSERWLVGPAAEAMAAHWRGHRVDLVRGLQGDALEVGVHHQGPPRALQLRLPAPRAAQLLLTGEFAPSAAAPPAPAAHAPLRTPRLSLRSAPVIAVLGNRVAVPLLDRPAIAVFPVPAAGSPKRGAVRRNQIPSGTAPLALVCTGRSVGALLRTERLPQPVGCFWQLQHFRGAPVVGDDEFAAPPEPGTLLPSARLDGAGQQPQFCVLDVSGRLYRWRGEVPGRSGARPAAPERELVADKVHALFQPDRDQLVYAARTTGGLGLRRLRVAHRMAMPLGVELVRVPEVVRLLFGDARAWRRGVGLCAVRIANDLAEAWAVRVPAARADIAARICPVRLAPGATAIGLVGDRGTLPFALVLLSADRRQLLLQYGDEDERSAEGPRRLLDLPAPAASWSFCADKNWVAVVTHAHGLVVLAVDTASVRLASQADGEPEVVHVARA